MGTLPAHRVPLGNPIFLHEDRRRIRGTSPPHCLHSRTHRLLDTSTHRPLPRRASTSTQTLESHRTLRSWRDGDPMVSYRNRSEDRSIKHGSSAGRNSATLGFHLRLLLWR